MHSLKIISGTKIKCDDEMKQKMNSILLLLLLLQPFYGCLDFVWDYLGEPVPER